MTGLNRFRDRRRLARHGQAPRHGAVGARRGELGRRAVARLRTTSASRRPGSHFSRWISSTAIRPAGAAGRRTTRSASRLRFGGGGAISEARVRGPAARAAADDGRLQLSVSRATAMRRTMPTRPGRSRSRRSAGPTISRRIEAAGHRVGRPDGAGRRRLAAARRGSTARGGDGEPTPARAFPKARGSTTTGRAPTSAPSRSSPVADAQSRSSTTRHATSTRSMASG